METTIIEEIMEILKRLSPKNQAYLITLVRVAETAENSIKNSTLKQSLEKTVEEKKGA